MIATVLSVDRENDPDMVAMLGTSVALHVSDIPFSGPLAGVRIGRIDGKWVMNPTQTQLEESDTDIFFVSEAETRSSWSKGARGLFRKMKVFEALVRRP